MLRHFIGIILKFVWLPLCIGLIFTAPVAWNRLKQWQISNQNTIAPLFTPQIDYWADDIARWSEQYNIDPNLMATIMQIESCGHPTVASHAGAQGLFQVMPFHFALGENMLNPETNAYRSANFIRECGRYAKGDPGMIMACYNGGPSVMTRPVERWANETLRYYRWGVGIYHDALQNADESATLHEWLAAGGASLCQRADSILGLGSAASWAENP